jgi:hypothetical protein
LGGRGLGKLEAGLMIIQRTHVLPQNIFSLTGENQAKPYAHELSTPTHKILVKILKYLAKCTKWLSKYTKSPQNRAKKLGRKIFKKVSNP